MKKFIILLMLAFMPFILTNCSDKSVGTSNENAVVEVSVDWDEVSNPPDERFTGKFGNESRAKLLKVDSTVTDFGVRIEYLSDDATFSQTVPNSNGDSTSLITLDVPTADSVAIYAIAVSETHVVNMGSIKSQQLQNADNYNFSVSDFKWEAPSWGAGPDFEPNGWNVARVNADSVGNGTKIQFNVVNPFDRPSKNPETEYDNFAIKVNGTGGIGEYVSNDVRIYNVWAERSDTTTDTTSVEWNPYLDGAYFNLPNGRYIVDQRGAFSVIWE